MGWITSGLSIAAVAIVAMLRWFNRRSAKQEGRDEVTLDIQEKVLRNIEDIIKNIRRAGDDPEYINELRDKYTR